MRLFLKEVYLKHSIQGINFCAWDADDLDGLEMQMPDALKAQIKDRKLSLIDTDKVWFLVAPPQTKDTNRYALSRFLAEDTDFGLYITYGCFVPKSKIFEEKILAVILSLIGTIYTLEKAVSPSLLKFIEDSKQAKYRHLAPLLRERIVLDGDIENVVKNRLIEYEKKLAVLVLNRIALIMQYPVSESDFFIFSHHSQKILADLWRDLDAFCMLPVAEFTQSAEIMRNRLMSYRLLLQKNLSMLCAEDRSWQEKTELLKTPYSEVKQMYADVCAQNDECDELLQKSLAYEQKKQSGSVLARLGIGKPKYESAQLVAHKQELGAKFFIDIIKLAKAKKDYLVYYEFEDPDAILNNDEYRHYALSYSTHAVDKLPMILRLPENRESFELAIIQEALEQDAHL